MDNLQIVEIEKNKRGAYIYYTYTRDYPAFRTVRTEIETSNGPTVVESEEPYTDQRLFEANTLVYWREADPENDIEAVTDVTPEQALEYVRAKLESEI